MTRKNQGKRLSIIDEIDVTIKPKTADKSDINGYTELLPVIPSASATYEPNTGTVFVTTKIRNGSKTNAKIILPILRDLQSQTCARSYRRSTHSLRNSLNNKRTTMLKHGGEKSLIDSTTDEREGSMLPRLDNRCSSVTSHGSKSNRDKCNSPLFKHKSKRKTSNF